VRRVPGQGPEPAEPADTVERALVVTAHPDDVDFGAAGTVARWTAAGTTVSYLVLTDGQAGGSDDRVARTDIPAIRHAEQRAAAAIVGVQDVQFLGGVDGELQVSLDLIRDIVAVIRNVRPQRVVAPSPERDWNRLQRSHPDHLAAGEATVQAIYPAARNPYAFPELRALGLEAWTVPELWLSAHPAPNHPVDVTDTFDLKMQAIRAHESQHPDPEILDHRMRESLGMAARAFGLADGRLAEAFRVVHIP